MYNFILSNGERHFCYFISYFISTILIVLSFCNTTCIFGEVNKSLAVLVFAFNLYFYQSHMRRFIFRCHKIGFRGSLRKFSLIIFSPSLTLKVLSILHQKRRGLSTSFSHQDVRYLINNLSNDWPMVSKVTTNQSQL